MAANHDVDFFEKYLNEINQGKIADQDELLDNLNEIDEILNGMDKGINILAKMGKTADPVVLEKRAVFQFIKDQLVVHLKEE